MNLSLEQKFTLRSFEDQVDKLNGEQARHFLVELYRQMMVRENFYKEFIRQERNDSGLKL
ncbi:MAG: NblA/ycf18 family protein [Cyanobacteria bacterium P01_D01_bin.73]